MKQMTQQLFLTRFIVTVATWVAKVFLRRFSCILLTRRFSKLFCIMPGGLKVFQRFLRILLGVGRSFYKAPGVPCPRESRENAHILLCPAWPRRLATARVWGHTAKRRIRALPGRGAWPQSVCGDTRLNSESGPSQAGPGHNPRVGTYG